MSRSRHAAVTSVSRSTQVIDAPIEGDRIEVNDGAARPVMPGAGFRSQPRMRLIPPTHNRGVSDGVRTLRLLPDEARRRLAPSFPDLDLAAVRIRVGLPRLVRAFAVVAPAAIVLGRTVYFTADAYDDVTPRGLASIGHELVHLRQIGALGFPLFAFRYAWAYLRGRLRGMSPEAAYLAIPFEAEAYALERELRSALETIATG